MHKILAGNLSDEFCLKVWGSMTFLTLRIICIVFSLKIIRGQTNSIKNCCSNFLPCMQFISPNMHALFYWNNVKSIKKIYDASYLFHSSFSHSRRVQWPHHHHDHHIMCDLIVAFIFTNEHNSWFYQHNSTLSRGGN